MSSDSNDRTSEESEPKPEHSNSKGKQQKTKRKQTKTLAVSLAIQELRREGKEALPGEIQERLKKRFKIDMPTTHISTIKSNLARKEREADSPNGSPESGGLQPGYPASAAYGAEGSGPQSSPGGEINVEEIQQIKELVKRLGARRLHLLVDLLDS